MKNTTITLSKVKYQKEVLLIISMPNDCATKEYIKDFNGISWNEALKCFCLRYSRQVTHTLFQYLRNKNYFVDYSALKEDPKQIAPPSQPKRNPVKIREKPQQEILDRISLFRNWMYQKRYSENTIKTYESMLLMFFGFHHTKLVKDIRSRDLEDYNTNYILANGFSHTYQNQTINALKLFYTYNGMDPLLSANLERPKKQSKLPEVLSIDEVKVLLASLTNLKHKTLLSILYACGLRIGETLNIKVRDLDLDRGYTHIKSGKGRKDRYVPLPKRMCSLLRAYIEAYKPHHFLFEGAKGAGYSAVSARQVLKRALRNSKIEKSVTLHTLRHSHATHLLENGTDIRYIQELLGHNSPKTTMIYTHVSSTSLDRIKNPFDDFED
ncbi:MAG: tyrosine-type recombinase/integrase [Eudoraea sp.]|uniref:tyrosine-type recombinase/integrase n=1 Tax=Eudoraea sp. TaxID=1979955 RepID=UPI003C741742